MVIKIKILSVLLGVLSANRLYAETFTNVVQVLDLNLTPTIVQQIDGECLSSPDRLFLSYLKYSSTGDLRGFLSLFDDTYAQSEFGMNSKSSLSDSDIADFRDFVLATGVTNRAVVAYNCSFTNGNAYIASQIQHAKFNQPMVKNESLVAVSTNGIWQIVVWQTE